MPKVTSLVYWRVKNVWIKNTHTPPLFLGQYVDYMYSSWNERIVNMLGCRPFPSKNPRVHLTWAVKPPTEGAETRLATNMNVFHDYFYKQVFSLSRQWYENTKFRFLLIFPNFTTFLAENYFGLALAETPHMRVFGFKILIEVNFRC